MIPVSQPQITYRDRIAVDKGMWSGMVSHRGPNVKKFEKEFAKYNKKKYGVSCNSGTNAIYLALKGLGIGKGDEVIVPEFTMTATAFAVSYTGAKPVFVDCKNDLNIDPDLIVDKITRKTKAIIPVHIYGRRCDMKQIIDIADKHKLYVVEDSAEAHGVKPVGDIACFSLFANKIITSGEGGILVTNNKKLATKAEWYANMAFDPEHTFLHEDIAHNFRMTNLQASLAVSQLSRLDKILEKRQKIADWYDEYLPEFMKMPKRDVVWMYDVVHPERDKLMKYLKRKGIETRMFFKPMSMQPPYKDKYAKLNATKYSKIGLYLPTFTDMTKGQVRYVSQTIRKF